jgi:DNA sulfur modification protein DndD
MSSEHKERLFIKKLDIENCGRFYGKGHSLQFSDSVEKNITIVIGYSGRGKSTIHDLIYWCMYGEFKSPNIDELDYGLINTNAIENLSEHQSVTASVTLELHNQHEEKYLITRELTATLMRNSTKREFNSLNNSRVSTGITFEESAKLIMKDESGNKIIEKDKKFIKNEINRHFPKDLSDFFLFDGENLVKFKNQSSSAQFIKDGITKISGLEILESLKRNSLMTANSIQKHIGGQSANAKPFNVKEEKLSGEKKTLEDDMLVDKTDLKKLQGSLEVITAKIEKNKTGSELIIKQKRVESEKNAAAKRLKSNGNAIRELLFEKTPQLLIQDVLKNSEKIFEKLEEDDKIPPSISRGAIDKILNSVPLKCVCGRHFEKTDNEKEPWMVLQGIKDTIIEDDLSQGISLGRNLISRIIDTTSKEKLNKEYYGLLDSRRDSRREIQEKNIEFSELENEIKKVDYDDGEDLGKMKNDCFEKIIELSGAIKIRDGELEDKEQEWNENHKRLEEALQKEGKYDKEKEKILLGNAVSKFSKILEIQIEEVLRVKTQNATSDYFTTTAPEKETFDHVDISENYDILVKDENDLVAGLSKGQAHVLGLSYVAGIRKITHTNTFLIIDSPLHNISGKSRNEISEVFSEYLPGVQIVLLVTDTEYLQGDPLGASPVIDILRENGHVWKEYLIEQDTTPEGYQTRKIKEFNRK